MSGQHTSTKVLASAPLAIRGLDIALPAHADRALAVEGIDLDVERGEILCLVGESGSGKSVIAHATMGLLPPALRVVGGTIGVDGENIAGAPEERLRAMRCTRMAMVFQEPATALNPLMRCGAQIDEVLAAHTSLAAAARRERTLAALAEVGIDDPARIHASFAQVPENTPPPVWRWQPTWIFSRTERFWKSCTSWKVRTRPDAAICSGGRAVMSSPPNTMRPAFGA